MKLKDIGNSTFTNLIENASAIRRLHKYDSIDQVDAFIGLAANKVGFYGKYNTTTDEVTALPFTETVFNSSAEITLLIEGNVKLQATPVNTEGGGISYIGDGKLTVGEEVVYGGTSNVTPIDSLRAFVPEESQMPRTVTDIPVTLSIESAHSITPPVRLFNTTGNSDTSYPIPFAHNTSAITTRRPLVNGGYVTANKAGTQRITQSVGTMFEFDGTEVSFRNSSAGGAFWIKINGKYVDNVYRSYPADQTIRYFKLTFAQRTQCKIEYISYNLEPTGIYTNMDAVVRQTNPKGPYCIVVGDSYNGTPTSYPRIIGDTLGWENIQNSGIGGTGFINDNAGTSQTFGERLQADVIDYKPDVAWFVGSINDDGSSPESRIAATIDVEERIHAVLPNCVFIWSMNAKGGPDKWSYGSVLVRDALKEYYKDSNNSLVVDPLEAELYEQSPVQAAIRDDISAGDSTFKAYGISAQSGRIPTFGTVRINQEPVEISNVVFGGNDAGIYYWNVTIIGTFKTAHTAGDLWKVAGNSYITGNGNENAPTANGSADIYTSVDEVHPTAIGQNAYGQSLGETLINKMYPRE